MNELRRNPGEGTLEEVDGRWRLRFVRLLPHPPEKVWRALTEEQHLQAWFPTTIEGDLTPGASLVFRHRGMDVPPITGELLACDPPRLLEFTWGFSGDPSERPELTRFELSPAEAGCTLTLTTTYDAVGKSARDGAGWHDCLDLLALHLSGVEPPGTGVERWKRLNRRYGELFGPQATTIGPPEMFKEFQDS